MLRLVWQDAQRTSTVRSNAIRMFLLIICPFSQYTGKRTAEKDSITPQQKNWKFPSSLGEHLSSPLDSPRFRPGLLLLKH